MAPATRKADGASTGGQSLVPRPRAAQDREDRAKWVESVKIARIETP
jgi:hypothetical protein